MKLLVGPQKIVTFLAARTVIGVEGSKIVALLRLRNNEKGSKPYTALLAEGGLNVGLKVYPMDDSLLSAWERIKTAIDVRRWVEFEDPEGEGVYADGTCIGGIVPAAWEYRSADKGEPAVRVDGSGLALLGAQHVFNVMGTPDVTIPKWAAAIGAEVEGPLESPSLLLASVMPHLVPGGGP